MSEHLSQCALFEWARHPAVLKRYPGIDLLEGSMNGVFLGKAAAGKAKACGQLKGAHDIRLPVARGGYIGLSIELKYLKGRPTPEQLAIAKRLEEEGHLVKFCWEWTDARDVIVDYLEGKNNDK